MKTMAGIVLFNPDILMLKQNILAIVNQVDTVLLVDNCSENIEDIRTLIDSMNRIAIIVSNHENKGIATAMNQIFEWADKHNFQWVLTLDQDSVCAPDQIEKYLPHVAPSIGVISPVIQYENASEKKYEKNIEEIEWCISSASFINIEAWKKVSGFDDKLFIDQVDYDFCYRIRKANYTILRCNNVRLLHQLGDGKEHIFLGRKIYVGHHNALRHYYYVRNNVYLLRKKEKTFWQVVVVFLGLLTKVIFFEKEKIKKISSMFKGAIEGIRNQ